MSCQEFGFALVSLETQEESDAIEAYILQGIYMHFKFFLQA
jgi:hypothetical protein